MPPSAEHIADTTKTPISTRSTSTPHHAARASVTSNRANLSPEAGETHDDEDKRENKQRDDAAPGEDIELGGVKRRTRVEVRERDALGVPDSDIRSEKRDVEAERHRHGMDAKLGDDRAFQEADERSERKRRSETQEQIGLAELDRNHRAERKDAQNAKIEFANDHRQPDAERDQPISREKLERIVDVEGRRLPAGKLRQHKERRARLGADRDDDGIGADQPDQRALNRENRGSREQRAYDRSDHAVVQQGHKQDRCDGGRRAKIWRTGSRKA
jgi:hypothetical protein